MFFICPANVFYRIRSISLLLTYVALLLFYKFIPMTSRTIALDEWFLVFKRNWMLTLGEPKRRMFATPSRRAAEPVRLLSLWSLIIVCSPVRLNNACVRYSGGTSLSFPIFCPAEMIELWSRTNDKRRTEACSTVFTGICGGLCTGYTRGAYELSIQ